MSAIINGAGLNSFRSQFPGGTADALAEIIDNSIQWKRPDVNCDINIIMIERGRGSKFKLDEILISDNGIGMSKDTISTCLTFGGGMNHGTEVDGSLGKFGVGLPFGSCSQSPNYHVFSWEDRSRIFHTFRDHLKYQPNEPVLSESVEHLTSLPREFYDLLPSLRNYLSGTIVQWKDCDRLDVSQAKTLINHINLGLGRIYRHFIGNGVTIQILVYRTNDNMRFEKVVDLCRPIGVFDPMFLKTNTILPEPYNTESTNLPWGGVEGTGEKVITFDEQVEGGTKKHTIKLCFSIAKPEIQTSLGGGSGLGKYYKKAQGISLVRAKRELKLADFGFQFPNGNGDPRHRWWSIEVLFEPISDTLLGVTANKTNANNFKYLESSDYAEMEKNGMIDEKTKLLHKISIEIDKAIKEMWKLITKRGIGLKSRTKCQSCGERSFIDGKCENCSHTSDVCQLHGITLSSGKCILCDRTPDIPMCIIHKVPFDRDRCPRCPIRQIDLSDNEKEELVRILKSDYPEIQDDQEALERTISFFVKSNRKHIIIFTDLRTPGIFINHINFQDKFVIIEANTQHPFYEQFIQKIFDRGDESQLMPLLLFIASWIETERNDYTNSYILERFRSSFGLNLMDVIANWSAV